MAPPRKKTARKKIKMPATAASPPPPSSAAPTPDAAALAESTNILAATSSSSEPPRASLMGIPLEVRQRIYGFVLEEEDPIQLEIRGERLKTPNSKEVVRRGAAAKKNRRREYDRKARRWINLPFKHTSILYVSKQVYAEAEPILYRNNNFSFERAAVVRDFLKVIGDRGRYLRYIRIEDGGYTTSVIRSALKMLYIAGGLRKLELSHSDVCEGRSRWPTNDANSITVEKIAKDCKRLAQSLKVYREQEGLRGNVANVFGFYWGECEACQLGVPENPGWARVGNRYYSHRYNRCGCSKVQEHNARLENELHQAIAKLIDPAKASEGAEVA